MARRAFNVTSVGASHIKKNKICQDCSASFEGDGFTCVIVSDGHGGDDYIRSDKGSEFAVSAARESVTDFVAAVKIDQLKADSRKLLIQLSKSIISEWNDKVWNHYSQTPLSEKERNELSEKAKQKYLARGRIESLYGATLIVAVVTDEYWFGLHIGDGKCVVKGYDGEFTQPIPWDEKCFLNATTSICDSDALGNFRYYFSETPPAAVFIGSDGIDDCFANDSQLHSLYDAIIASFGQHDFDEALSELKDYIPRLSAKGSGDDMSVAGIIDVDNIVSFMNHAFDEQPADAEPPEEQLGEQLDEEDSRRGEVLQPEAENEETVTPGTPNLPEPAENYPPLVPLPEAEATMYSEDSDARPETPSSVEEKTPFVSAISAAQEDAAGEYRYIARNILRRMSDDEGMQ
ncbi:MAG: protein phosphatase 2C domain-containing protein [Synergistaceae bacterium]|nr:protein phosphatase 2C domain-containing protein [Synergistaceae bacterium]